jgi:phosphoribosylcarboxyaminoimidazole (NCAIR) mutase
MEKITLQLDADISMAIKDFEKVDESLEKVDGSIQSLNDELVTTKKGFKGLTVGAKLAKIGIKGIGTALKGAGIGLAVAAFTLLKDIFKENQVVADAFKTAFEFLSIAFNDFANFIFSSSDKITGFFKSIFDDPLGSVKSLGLAIKNNIIDRFNSLLDTLGFAGTAIKKLFEGDFAGAAESAKQATLSLVDTIGIVDTETLAKGFDAVSNGVKNYVTETGKAAAANVQLEKTARIAEAANQGLIEQYDIQAESLRQIRDDESKTISERIEANNKLAEVLDEQEKAMMANANARVLQAEAELAKNKENIDNQIAYQEALNEQAAIEAQITGFRSEQQVNVNALLKEEQDARRELAEIGKTEAELERLEALNIYNDRKQLIERTISDEVERAEALKKIKADYDAYIRSADKVAAAEANKIAEDAQKAKLDTLRNGLAGIAANLGKETAAGKAAAISSALISTYQGAQDSYKSLAGIPIIGPALGFAAAAAATVAGLANVKAITSTKTPQVAGGGGTPSVSAPSRPSAPQPPAFNIVGAGAGNQLAETIAGQTQKPIKAFVTSQDVTTAQSLERNIVEGASI